MLLATIDIGSNAVRLLFSNVFERDDVIYADKASLIRIPVRLGMDVFNDGCISSQRREHLLKTLTAFKMLMEVYGPDGFDACATAAMREATNGEAILKEIREKTKMNVRIIDGLEEADIISTANNSIMNRLHKMTIYIDVGGGSTEMSLYDKDAFMSSNSFKIGSIRLLNNHVEKSEWNKMKAWIKDLGIKGCNYNCIGSGGNINKLTKLFGDQSNNTIQLSSLKAAVEKLKEMSVEERMKNYGLRNDRADVIVPAGEIFLSILKWSGQSKIMAPKIGLADGLAIELYKKLIK